MMQGFDHTDTAAEPRRPHDQPDSAAMRIADHISTALDAIKIANDEDGLNAFITVDRDGAMACLLYTSPSPRDGLLSRMPSSA